MRPGGRQIKISQTFRENRANYKKFDASRSKIGPLDDSQWPPELATLGKKSAANLPTVHQTLTFWFSTPHEPI